VTVNVPPQLGEWGLRGKRAWEVKGVLRDGDEGLRRYDGGKKSLIEKGSVFREDFPMQTLKKKKVLG